jgi:PKD repeat protein
MKYRKATVLASEDASTAKTKTIDINLTDVISRLQVKFNGTNTDIVPTAQHAKQITKIELVDGSDVLLSMSGQEIEAKMYYDYGVGPSYEREFRNGVDNYLTLDLLFGRELWDTQLAFDPKKFKNPQLKITHNKALGGSLPNAATLEVFADIFDEKIVSPVGFLMNKEFYTYTTPASAANEYIDLPRDYPIKRLMLMTSKADSWWENLVTNVKISENNDARIPIDIGGGDLVSLVQTMYGEYRELIVDVIRGTGPQSMWITPTDSAYALISGIGIGASNFVTTDNERTGGYQTITADATHTFRALVAGYLPHGCLPLDFGDPNDLDDWYDVTKKGSVQLIPKASGSVSLNVILEQLRKY